MSLSLRSFAGVSLISLGLVGAGFYGGEHHASAATIASSPRFEKLTETTALDTKTGQVCDTDQANLGDGAPPLPKGYHLNTGRSLCSGLSSR